MSIAGGAFIDIKNFVKMTKKVREEYHSHLLRNAKTVGAFMEGEVKKTLSQPGTGRIYKRSGGAIEHQASAPGEPPAVDTGMLRASVTNQVIDVSQSRIEVWIGTNKKYGKTLELGTSKIAPRPWLFVTIKKNWGKALMIWEGFLERGKK